MRDVIWYELVQIKFGEKYLALYLSLQHKLKKLFKIFILIFSGSGILGWQLWQPIAWIALVLIAIIQLLSLIENQIIRSDDQIAEIAKLRELYLKYFHKLEKLWIEFDNEEINDSVAKEQFFEVRKTDLEPLEALDNKIGIKKWTRLIASADKETRDYFQTYHSI